MCPVFPGDRPSDKDNNKMHKRVQGCYDEGKIAAQSGELAKFQRNQLTGK